MDAAVAELRSWVERMIARVFTMLHTAPPGTLTGLLGAAVALAALHYMRGDRRGGPGGDAGASGRAGRPAAAGRAAGGMGAGSRSDAPTTTGSGASTGTSSSSSSSKAAAAASASAAAAALASATPLGRVVRSRLQGVRRVVISVPGVLLEEWGPGELQEGASLRRGAGALLRELAGAAECYLIAHVADDIGQAVVTGALESAHLLGGGGGGRVPAHRLLFCSTLAGKVSLVRQLEPDLHIDGHAATIEELRRFMPQLLHIVAPGDKPAGGGAVNIVSAGSLSAFFGEA